MPTSTAGRSNAQRVFAFAIAAVAATLLIANQAAPASASDTYAQVSVGVGFTCGLTVGGDVECWGENKYGQLGDGTTTNRLTPTDAHIGKATAISAGVNSACAIVSGAAVCWGQGSSGQLGNGTAQLVGQPGVVLGMGSGVTAISVGNTVACAVVSGAAKCWGTGFLGDGGGSQTSLLPMQVSGLTSGVGQISAGIGGTACAIDSTQHVRCWGKAGSGQMGNNTDVSTGNLSQLAPATTVDVENATAIAVSDLFVCAIAGTVDHAVRCWGDGALGELGTGIAGAQSSVPVTPVGLFSGAEGIAVGLNHACATGAGQVVCWGSNSRLQIGNASVLGQANSPVPVDGMSSNVDLVAAKSNTSCAQQSGQLKCWGGNATGQLGNGTAGSSPSPISVAGDSTGATDVASSSGHSCAVINGAVKCWGQNGAGQLGTGTQIPSTVPVAVQNLAPGATSIAAGFDYSCAAAGGAAYCWGHSGNGALGTGNATELNPAQVTGLDAGVTKVVSSEFSVCAIVNGGAQCWGAGTSGQLGAGIDFDSFTPQQVTGLTSGVTDIAIANDHACAVVGGAAYCWGSNVYGGLGNGGNTNTTTPVAVAGLTSGVTAVGTGSGYSCFVVNGAVKCTGINWAGQLDTGDINYFNTVQPALGLTSGVTQLSSGDTASCAIGDFGTRCWGDNTFGESGSGLAATYVLTAADVSPALVGVSKVAMGSGHACAVVTAGVQCWGDGSQGELGTGTAYTRAPQTVNNSTDTAPPIINLVASFTDGASLGAAAQTITATATDNKGTIARLQCKLNGAAFANCVTPWNLTLTQGANTMTIEAEDDSGNVTTSTLTATLDSVAPVITIDGPATVYGANPQPIVYFAIVENGSALATVECKTDSGLYASCPANEYALNLTEGSHVITVRAIDVLGNTGTATVTIVIDSTLPALTFDPPAGVTTTLPAFTFSATDASPFAFECKIDIASVYEFCDSPWTPAAVLTEGTHTVFVRVTDYAGNATLKSVPFVVDTVAPTVTITAPRIGAATNDKTPDTAFTIGNPDADLATTKCSIDAGVPATCTSPYTAATLADGPHTVTVTVADTYGNASSDVDNFVVDTVAPAVDIQTPVQNGYALSRTPDIEFTVDETAGDVQTVKCSVDAAVAVNCVSPFTTAMLSEAAHSVVVTSTDVAGNTTSDSVNFTIDATPPIVSVLSPTAGVAATDNTPTFTFTTGIATDIASRTCQLDTGTIVACTSPYTAAPLPDGGHTFKLVVKDVAGNTVTVNHTVYVDTTAPGVSITSPAGGSTTLDHTPTIEFATTNPDADLADVTCSVDGGTAVTCASPRTLATLTGGVHTVVITVSDFLGNTRTATVQFTVVDPVLPPTEPVVPPTPPAQDPPPPPPPSITAPLLGKFAGSAKYAKPITGPVTCASGCTLQLTLTLGKKKLVLTPMTLPAGSTSATINLPSSARKKIKAAIKKSQKVTLTFSAVNSAGSSAPKTIKLK